MNDPLIDSRTAWIVASAALAASSIGFGAPLAVAVAMKPIAAAMMFCGSTLASPAAFNTPAARRTWRT